MDYEAVINLSPNCYMELKKSKYNFKKGKLSERQRVMFEVHFTPLKHNYTLLFLGMYDL